MTKIKYNKREENIIDVANWLYETSSVYYDYALDDAQELLETNQEEFFKILKQTDNENHGTNKFKNYENI